MTADEGLIGLVAKIRDLADQLTVPLIFAGGGSGGDAWRYEPETSIAGDYWIHHVLPSLLRSVEVELAQIQCHSKSITDAEQQDEIHDALKLLILGLAKFVAPSRVTLLPLPGQSDVQPSRWEEGNFQSELSISQGPDLVESFTGTYRNQSRAKELLHRSVGEYERCRQKVTSDSAPTRPMSHLLPLDILQHHVKPLFRSQARQSRFSDETGRLRAERQNLSGGPGALSWDRAGGEMWHDIPWKGGAAGPTWIKKVPARIPNKASAATDEAANALVLLQDRHIGLGAASVFAWAAEALGGGSSRKVEERPSQDWEQAWPLIVPPLVTLLENSETNARLVGTRAFYSCLLREPLQECVSRDELDHDSTAADGNPSSSQGSSTLAMPIRLLLRTGLVPLLSSVLAASMTNYSDPLSYLSLSEAIACSRALTLLTTSRAAMLFERSLKPRPSHSGNTDSLPRGLQGEQEAQEMKRLVARFDQLCTIVADGLLRPWSYITVPRSTAGMVSSASASKRPARNTALAALIDDFEQQQRSEMTAAAAASSEQENQSLEAAEKARAEDEREAFAASVQTMLALLRISQQLWQDLGPAGCARFADSALEVLIALLTERSTADVDKNEDSSHDGPALAQLSLAYEASGAICALSAQWIAPPRETEGSNGSADLRPFPALSPDFESRAEQVVFAAAACWIKLGLDQADAPHSQQVQALRDVLRRRLQTMFQLISSAIPRLGVELEKEILSNDTSYRLSLLFSGAAV